MSAVVFMAIEAEIDLVNLAIRECDEAIKKLRDEGRLTPEDEAELAAIDDVGTKGKWRARACSELGARIARSIEQ